MRIIKILCILLCLAMALPLIVACGDGEYEKDEDGAVKLSFKAALKYDFLKELNGKKVTINGYVATSSPVDGSFIFLMNMPYQSCPFCIPNTSELSNTMEVYPKNGKSFEYTASAVKVVGELEVAPEGELFTDKFGYEFGFKIVNATYKAIGSEELGESFAVWEKFAQSGVIDEIYKMYDYVDFVCKWNEYFVDSYTDDKGVLQPGYYLYASDALASITTGSKSYGNKEGYFDDLVKKVQAVDPTAFNELVENIRQAEALAKRAVAKLNDPVNGYTYEKKYVEKFKKEDYVYTINGGDGLKKELDVVYAGFENWLGSWEL